MEAVGHIIVQRQRFRQGKVKGSEILRQQRQARRLRLCGGLDPAERAGMGGQEGAIVAGRIEREISIDGVYRRWLSIVASRRTWRTEGVSKPASEDFVTRQSYSQFHGDALIWISFSTDSGCLSRVQHAPTDSGCSHGSCLSSRADSFKSLHDKFSITTSDLP
ncbi:hypothetical protein ACT9ST_15460 [Sphingobium limneticum]|uniref:hypothetical protein n=1 Tax=Sphingobium limneticum TaxID=1007511 RepID=UPI0020114CB2|nr:hypothetical protein [Sphingobium limneticum]